jgi:hypothetical protein
VVNRRKIAAVAGAAALALAVASWAPALATEPPAPGGVSVGGPAVIVASIGPTNSPGLTPLPTSNTTLAPGQTPTASPIPTPTPVATASPVTTAPAASSTPMAAATQSPQPGSQGGGSTDSPIPMLLGGILLLGLLAGILTFVLLGWRRAKG